MSVNFGYGGYGMMNEMMMGNMMMNSMMAGQESGGNAFQNVKQKYGCDHCYQYGPVPYNYPMHVNPLPKQVTNPSLITRIFRRFMGY